MKNSLCAGTLVELEKTNDIEYSKSRKISKEDRPKKMLTDREFIGQFYMNHYFENPQLGGNNGP
jgi:hypothetical protein